LSDKTEKPTRRRIDEARKEGQVAKSQELNTAAILFAGILLLNGPGRSLCSELQSMIVSSINSLQILKIQDSNIQDIFYKDAVQLGPLMMIMLGGFLATGVIVTLAQTQFLWASKRMNPDLGRLNPLKGLKRIFSATGLMELVRALLKLVVVGFTAYIFLKSRYQELLILCQMDYQTAIHNWTNLAISMAVRVGLVYLVIAAADYGYQRWKYMRSLRMTKDQ